MGCQNRRPGFLQECCHCAPDCRSFEPNPGSLAKFLTDHPQGNCLHEIFFDQAISRAEELDAYYKANGKTVGPLHGVPVSLKDQFHVKGNDTSMGYIGWIGTYQGSTDEKLLHNVDSQLVSELLGLGAVLFCKVILFE